MKAKKRDLSNPLTEEKTKSLSNSLTMETL